MYALRVARVKGCTPIKTRFRAGDAGHLCWWRNGAHDVSQFLSAVHGGSLHSVLPFVSRLHGEVACRLVRITAAGELKAQRGEDRQSENPGKSR